MANIRPAVPAEVKTKLVEEAGGKCANPGCPSIRTHLHHIDEWAVCEAHDDQAMIAICPTCHDAVHHGPLKISDDTLRRWKAIRREPVRGDVLYAEPAPIAKLLLGSTTIVGLGVVRVFGRDDVSGISLTLTAADTMSLDLAVSATSGAELLRVSGGHLIHCADERLDYRRVPGRAVLSAPVEEEFIPAWALSILREHEPGFADDGRVTLLDLEVLEPGLVSAKGVWNQDSENVVAVTAVGIYVVRPKPLVTIELRGGPDPEEGVLHYVGQEDMPLFGIGGPGVIPLPAGDPPKVGRNDPCWCGSGKKYKKCHGA